MKRSLARAWASAALFGVATSCGSAADQAATPGKDAAATDAATDTQDKLDAKAIDSAATPTGPQFFVATDGDDANPGTLEKPWRTIQKAMTSATPGSTVNVRGGTYPERLVANVSGEAGSPITFQPYGFAGSPACGGYSGKICPGEQVVLDYAYLGVVTEPQPVLLISGKQQLVVQGLVFQNYSVDGPMHVGIQVDGGSHDIAFRWIRVENFKNVHPDGPDGTSMLATARIGWGSTGADNVVFSDSQFYKNKSNMAEVLTWDLSSSGGVAERNHVSECDGIAISVYRGAHDYAFRNNLVEWAGVKPDGTLVYPNHGETGIGLYNDGGHDGVIEANIVKNSGFGIESLAEGPGSGGGAQPPVYAITIRNNILIGNHYGMTIGTWYSDVDGSSVHDHDILNNSIYGGIAGFTIRPFDSATVKVRNNIVAAASTAYVNPLAWNVGSSFDYNLYSGGGSGPDAHALNADPKFSNPAAGDFRLLPGSPAIDAGDHATTPEMAGDTDARGLPRFAGAWIDLGANEAQ